VCQGEAVWSLLRRGDAVVSWACDGDVAAVCHRLQRDWEVTELVVVHFGKRVEWAEIGQSLRDVDEAARP
jgi:hypothetical protein